MAINIEKLSLEELKALRKNLDRAIASYEERALAKAKAELEAKAKEMGFTLAQLVDSSKSKKRRAAAVAKYGNPENSAETWSGRGRRPAWFTAALAAGKSESELLIK